MDELDFSELTDDQLIALVRGALNECSTRGQAVAMAAQAVGIDATEKLKIAKAAAEQQAAVERAKERERIASEAREAVAREAEKQRASELAAESEKKKEAAKEAAKAAIAAADQKIEFQKSWLIRAAEIVGRNPESISVIEYGSRILINPNCDRYSHKHLSDFDAAKNEIKTTRELAGKKKDLIAFSVEFRAAFRAEKKVVLIGNEFDFSEVTA